MLGVALIAFGLIAWLSRNKVPHAHSNSGSASYLQSSVNKASDYKVSPDDPEEAKGTIFVSIISYRDPDCKTTIEELFDQADYPERVFAGICEQNAEGPGAPEDCSLAHLPVRLRSNVRYHRMNASEAKGIPLARQLAASSFDNQDYFMQIDAHSVFAKGWDSLSVRLINQLRKCSKKPVLSHYPLAWGDENNPAIPRICHSKFTEQGVIRLDAAIEYAPSKDFVKVPYAAGGFMFFPGQVINEMPHDPHLPYLFEGDEILWSIRLYTHGWDVYTPNTNIIWHRYKTSADKVKKGDVYSDHGDRFQWLLSQALQKVRWMLDDTQEKPSDIVLKDFDRYKLGTDRPLTAWEEFAMVDIKNKTVNGKDKFCTTDLAKDLVCPGL